MPLSDPLKNAEAGSEGGPAEQELQSSLRSALIGGRWAILLAELAAILLRLPWLKENADLQGELSVAAVLLYNVLVLVVLLRRPAREIPVGVFLAVDVMAIGLLVSGTEGIRSPFTGLYYLVILMGAIHYNLLGGLAVAGGAVLIILLASVTNESVWPLIVTGETRTQTLPYLVMTGAFAGYLVQQLKRLHERRIEVEERLRQAQFRAEERERQAALAREIQRTTLADPPHHPVYELAVRYEPLQEVGGDFYAFMPAGRRLGVILGDVSGKGLPAALTSTSICHLTHLMRPMDDPRTFLSELNRALAERLPEDAFASLAFACADPKSRCLEVYSAGHLPALVVRDGRVDRIHLPGLPLGVFPEGTFEPAVTPFSPGDLLVLYSDALVETRNEAGQEFSLEGLERLVREHAGRAPQELAAVVTEEVRSFGHIQDDLTLLVVRYPAEG